MKSFTPTEFRADSSKVYNEVMVSGSACINHRDRPRMIILTEEALDIAISKGVHPALTKDKP